MPVEGVAYVVTWDFPEKDVLYIQILQSVSVCPKRPLYAASLCIPFHEITVQQETHPSSACETKATSAFGGGEKPFLTNWGFSKA